MASGKSDFYENAILLHTYSGSQFSVPTTIYIGLSTAAASDASVGTEVTGGAYARASTDANSINFGLSATGTIKNLTAINFGTPSASWGTVVSAFTSNSITSSASYMHWGDLTSNKTINSGDTVSFAASSIVISED